MQVAQYLSALVADRV